jgi:F-box-like
MDIIPNEIIDGILLFLEVKDLASAKQVCKLWQQLATIITNRVTKVTIDLSRANVSTKVYSNNIELTITHQREILPVEITSILTNDLKHISIVTFTFRGYVNHELMDILWAKSSPLGLKSLHMINVSRLNVRSLLIQGIPFPDETMVKLTDSSDIVSIYSIM